MRVAILHYHLRPGGVTRVLELAVEALLGLGWDPLVVVGEAAPEGCRIGMERIRIVPGLAYGEENADGLQRGVDAACREFWGADADLLHTHNHSLGKNLSLPVAVARWSAAGRPMVLQMHDFAENGRPANYRLLAGCDGLLSSLYPSGGGQALVVLSSRAAEKLRRCGAAAAVLPNPVVMPPRMEAVDPGLLGADSIVVYPTRAIRRKNIGEFLLYSTGARRGEIFVLTSAPGPGADRALHDGWERFAGGAGLPVVFDAAARIGRQVYDFLPAAGLCVTTSVEEGFGMAFLEPWAAGCGVAGRDLPGVTGDFRKAGLQLDSIVPACPVPADWVDRERFAELARCAVSGALASYGLPARKMAVGQAMDAVFSCGTADFGRLDEVEQMRVIRRFIESGREPPALRTVTSETISTNAAVIADKFSLSEYARGIKRIYSHCVERGGRSPAFIDARAVLDEFLDFSDFSALRVAV